MIGLLIAQYNEVALIPECLVSWISYREHNPLKIAILDVCFEENGVSNSVDGSIQLLKQYKNDNKIDYFEILSPGLKEHEARNVGLKWLLDQGCDLIISSAMDEIFKKSEIEQIFRYVEKEKYVGLFKIAYKNYVFDRWHFVRGFVPHRIWRTKYNGYRLDSFFWDDDARYINSNNDVLLDKSLPSKVIPNVEIKHLTWCNPKKVRKKISYQNKHFKSGFGCSFRVNVNRIEFNPEYYLKTGEPFPEVYEEEMNIFKTPYGKFVLDPMDGVCRVIAENKLWDEWIKGYLDGLTKEMIVVEVGAHVGGHTVYIANKCRFVHAFEPQWVNYERLVKNVELNELKNVQCYNVALYSKETKMAVNGVLDQSSINYNGCQACSLTLYENEGGDVEAKTLDSYKFERVDFIKTDCENCDIEVLKGGIETIKQFRPPIIFEYDARHSRSHLDLFESLNYNVKEIATSNFLATPK